MNAEGTSSLRQGLAEAVRRGAAVLSAEARRAAAGFVLAQLNEDGGFRGRAAASDLYYTVFGLECARALEAPLPGDRLRSFVLKQPVATLDFVHLTCLARCVESLWPGQGPASVVELLRQRLALYRCASGGYHRQPGQKEGTLYETFLGLLAGESLGDGSPLGETLGEWLHNLRRQGGGYVNSRGYLSATTPVTAAALTLCGVLGQPIPEQSVEWLLDRQGPGGGFCAAALVPLPDLLSTATALHALSFCKRLADIPQGAHRDFVLSLRSASGGFAGHAFDRLADCEYTFYALLALGHLTG